MADDAKLGEAYVEIRAKLDGLIHDLQKAQDETRKSTTAMQGHFTSLQHFLSGFGNAATPSFLKLTSAVAAGELAFHALAGAVHAALVDLPQFIQHSLAAVAAIGEQAAQLGLTTKAYQEYAFAAKQVGVSQEEFNTAVARLTRNIGEARDAASPAAIAFHALAKATGTVVDTTKDTSTVLTQVIAALGRLKDPADRAAAATALLGREGGRLVNGFLAEGPGAVDRLRAAAHTLGVVLSDDVIRSATEAHNKLDALGKVLTAQVQKAVANLSPKIVELTDKLIAALPQIEHEAEAWGKTLVAALGQAGTAYDKLKEHRLAALGAGIGAVVTTAIGLGPGPGLVAGGAGGELAHQVVEGSDFFKTFAQTQADKQPPSLAPLAAHGGEVRAAAGDQAKLTAAIEGTTAAVTAEGGAVATGTGNFVLQNRALTDAKEAQKKLAEEIKSLRQELEGELTAHEAEIAVIADGVKKHQSYEEIKIRVAEAEKLAAAGAKIGGAAIADLTAKLDGQAHAVALVTQFAREYQQAGQLGETLDKQSSAAAATRTALEALAQSGGSAVDVEKALAAAQAQAVVPSDALLESLHAQGKVLNVTTADLQQMRDALGQHAAALVEDTHAADNLGKSIAAAHDIGPTLDELRQETDIYKQQAAGLLSVEQAEIQVAAAQAALTEKLKGGTAAEIAQEAANAALLKSEEQRRDFEKQLANLGPSTSQSLITAAGAADAAFIDFFDHTLATGKADFKSLTDAIKGLFIKMLAEMAVQALIKPIIVPVFEALGGVLGIGGAGGVVSQVLGGGGGGGGGGGLDFSNLASAGGLLVKGAAAFNALDFSSFSGFLGSLSPALHALTGLGNAANAASTALSTANFIGPVTEAFPASAVAAAPVASPLSALTAAAPYIAAVIALVETGFALTGANSQKNLLTQGDWIKSYEAGLGKFMTGFASYLTLGGWISGGSFAGMMKTFHAGEGAGAVLKNAWTDPKAWTEMIIDPIQFTVAMLAHRPTVGTAERQDFRKFLGTGGVQAFGPDVGLDRGAGVADAQAWATAHGGDYQGGLQHMVDLEKESIGLTDKQIDGAKALGVVFQATLGPNAFKSGPHAFALTQEFLANADMLGASATQTMDALGKAVDAIGGKGAFKALADAVDAANISFEDAKKTAVDFVTVLFRNVPAGVHADTIALKELNATGALTAEAFQRIKDAVKVATDAANTALPVFNNLESALIQNPDQFFKTNAAGVVSFEVDPQSLSSLHDAIVKAFRDAAIKGLDDAIIKVAFDASVLAPLQGAITTAITGYEGGTLTLDQAQGQITDAVNHAGDQINALNPIFVLLAQSSRRLSDAFAGLLDSTGADGSAPGAGGLPANQAATAFGFNLGIQQQIAALAANKADPTGVLAQFQALNDAERARVDAAKAAGADLVQVEKLAGLERAKLITDLQKNDNDQLKQLADQRDQIFQRQREAAQQALDSIQQAIDNATASTQSPLAPRVAEQNAETLFNSLAAKARGGDLDAAKQLPDAFQKLTSTAEAVYAHGPEFARIFQGGLATLREILGGGVDPFASHLSAGDQKIVDSIAEQTATLHADLDRIARLGATPGTPGSAGYPTSTGGFGLTPTAQGQILTTIAALIPGGVTEKTLQGFLQAASLNTLTSLPTDGFAGKLWAAIKADFPGASSLGEYKAIFSAFIAKIEDPKTFQPLLGFARGGITAGQIFTAGESGMGGEAILPLSTLAVMLESAFTAALEHNAHGRAVVTRLEDLYAHASGPTFATLVAIEQAITKLGAAMPAAASVTPGVTGPIPTGTTGAPLTPVGHTTDTINPGGFAPQIAARLAFNAREHAMWKDYAAKEEDLLHLRTTHVISSREEATQQRALYHTYHQAELADRAAFRTTTHEDWIAAGKPGAGLPGSFTDLRTNNGRPMTPEDWQRQVVSSWIIQSARGTGIHADRPLDYNGPPIDQFSIWTAKGPVPGFQGFRGRGTPTDAPPGYLPGGYNADSGPFAPPVPVGNPAWWSDWGPGAHASGGLASAMTMPAPRRFAMPTLPSLDVPLAGPSRAELATGAGGRADDAIGTETVRQLMIVAEHLLNVRDRLERLERHAGESVRQQRLTTASDSRGHRQS